MAIYVVEIKLPYERISSTFAVMHSTTDTMFSPTFSEHDELIAHMFAAEYSESGLHDYTDAGQSRLVCHLQMFLNESFSDYAEPSASLPDAWRAELAEMESCDEDSPVPDASDLLCWYQDGNDCAQVAQRAFHAWRKDYLQRA